MTKQPISADEHTHEFVLIAIRADGTRIYGCVGCQKTKTVLTTDALNAEPSDD